jgi:hypothetical protein
MKPCLIEVWKDADQPFILNMNNVISIKRDTISRNAATVLTFSNNETFRIAQTVEEIITAIELANQNSYSLM